MLINAYAKINLTLGIVRLRRDGYHELDTVMQTVSLCDEIELDNVDENSFCVISGNAPEDESNLCVKARNAFVDYTKRVFPVRITLRKRIPSKAGLGGGSADAAAVLRGMNALSGENLSDETLCEIASRVGSDVPFLINGGLAHCTGRGEIIEPLHPLEKQHVVIAMGDTGLSTPDMFRMADGIYGGACPLPKPFERNSLQSCVYNAFQPLCAVKCADVPRLNALMRELGAFAHAMSGSGSAVFGLFKDEETAKAASEKLKKLNYYSEYCVTV